MQTDLLDEQKLKNQPKFKIIVKIIRVLLSVAVCVGMFYLLMYFCSIVSNEYDNLMMVSFNGWNQIGFETLMIVTFLFAYVVTGLVADIIWDKKNEKITEVSFNKNEKTQKKGKITSLLIMIAVCVLPFIFCFYISMFNCMVITDDSVIVKSPFNPNGTQYSYSQIKELDISSDSRKLHYEIIMDSGDVFAIPTGSLNAPDYDDKMVWFYSEFTNKIKDLDIPVNLDCSISDIDIDEGDKQYINNIFN